jgi:Bacterial PH domain
VDRSKVVADKVRVVDLDRETELAPRGRTNGLDLFSYKEGWWSLHTHEKAFVVLSHSKSVVYIPTTAGFSILFSAADPEKLVASLH